MIFGLSAINLEEKSLTRTALEPLCMIGMLINDKCIPVTQSGSRTVLVRGLPPKSMVLNPKVTRVPAKNFHQRKYTESN